MLKPTDQKSMETENTQLFTNEQLFLAKVERLEQEIESLRAQNISLREYLDTKITQGEQLSQVNHRLQTEILDRQQTETALRLLLERLSSEKNDL